MNKIQPIEKSNQTNNNLQCRDRESNKQQQGEKKKQAAKGKRVKRNLEDNPFYTDKSMFDKKA